MLNSQDLDITPCALLVHFDIHSCELRGTAFGLFNIVIGISYFISNVTFGFLWDSYNFSFAASYSIVLSLAGITGMIVFLKRY